MFKLVHLCKSVDYLIRLFNFRFILVDNIFRSVLETFGVALVDVFTFSFACTSFDMPTCFFSLLEDKQDSKFGGIDMCKTHIVFLSLRVSS